MPCGEREQWPSLVQKHKMCENCEAIKLKKTHEDLRKMAKIRHCKDI